ncbi:MAG: hypothetical protein WDW36_007844 [Sanguina aurantia]
MSKHPSDTGPASGSGSLKRVSVLSDQLRHSASEQRLLSTNSSAASEIADLITSAPQGNAASGSPLPPGLQPPAHEAYEIHNIPSHYGSFSSAHFNNRSSIGSIPKELSGSFFGPGSVSSRISSSYLVRPNVTPASSQIQSNLGFNLGPSQSGNSNSSAAQTGPYHHVGAQPSAEAPPPPSPPHLPHTSSASAVMAIHRGAAAAHGKSGSAQQDPSHAMVPNGTPTWLPGFDALLLAQSTKADAPTLDLLPSVTRSSESCARGQSGPAAGSLGEPLLESPHKGGQASPHPAGASTPKRAAGGGGEVGRRGSSPVQAAVFGVINGVVGLPSLIAFAAIVFQAPTYAPYLGSMCKLFFFSSAVHQLVFLMCSSLPFAVGQVQDVGLIFLSAMATSIADIVQNAGLGAEVALGTSMFTMTVSTLIVGFLLVLVGKYQLAQLIQYVPLSCIGAYLGFVGYFCMSSGAALAMGIELPTLGSWLHIFALDPLLKLAITLATSFLFMWTMSRFSHPLVLPCVLCAVPLSFHAILLLSGTSLATAQDLGWVSHPTTGNTNFWELWGLFNIRSIRLEGIYLPAMFGQIPKLLGLFFVVCFGSCMDIAAIQQDLPRPIDFNGELITVGLSNMVTGMLGAGYTGSYIFSQTVFTMRAGVNSRVMGMTIVAMELGVFLLPFDVVQFMPNFFFGALLMWFGCEIARDWLFHSYRKLSFPEYILLWFTFAAIMYTGLEVGIAAGLVLACFYFAYQYAQSQVSSVGLVSASSGTVRGYEQQAALEHFSHRIASLSLSGFIFFGSSTSLATKIQEVATRLVAVRDSSVAMHKALAASDSGTEKHARHSVTAALLDTAPLYILLDMRLVNGMDSTGARTFGGLTSLLASQGVTLLLAGLTPAVPRALLRAHGVQLTTPEAMGVAFTDAPEPLTSENSDPSRPSSDLDPAQPHMQKMHGSMLDLLQKLSVDLDPSDEEANRAADRIAGATAAALAAAAPAAGCCWEFASLQVAVRHLEDVFLGLAVAGGLCDPPSLRVTLQELFTSHLRELSIDPSLDLAQHVALIYQSMTRVELTRGSTLFRKGDPLQQLYMLESGILEVSSAGGGGGANPSGRGLPQLPSQPPLPRPPTPTPTPTTTTTPSTPTPTPTTGTANRPPGRSQSSGKIGGGGSSPAGKAGGGVGSKTGSSSSSSSMTKASRSRSQVGTSNPAEAPAVLGGVSGVGTIEEGSCQAEHSLDLPPAGRGNDRPPASAGCVAVTVHEGGEAGRGVGPGGGAGQTGQGRTDSSSSSGGSSGGSGGSGSGEDTRRLQYGPGCLIGAPDFYLQRPATSSATCVSRGCSALSLSRATFDRLLLTHPTELNLLQLMLMRGVCLELTTQLEVLH